MINLGYFYGVISAMFWAISGISYEILSNNTENKAIYIILFFLFSSDFISLIFLIKFILKTKNFLSLKNYRKGIFFGGLAGVFGGTIGMFSYLMAIDLLGVNYAVPLSSTFPLFAGIIAYFFLKEKIQFIGFIGFFITIFSSVILFISKGINQFNLIGLVFIFFCILGWALEVVLSSYAMTFTSEYITYFSRLCFSCLGYIILLFFILKVDISNIINFIDYQKIGCFFIIVLSTFLSYLLYYKAIYLLGTIKAMSINITYSIWTVLFSYFLFDIEISRKLIFCCIGILLGTGLTLYVKKE